MQETVLSLDELTNADAAGPVVVSFFATWCKPCVRHLPEIDDAVARTTSLGTKAVLIAYGQRAIDVQPLLRALAITLPVVLDDQYAIASRLGVSKLPHVLVLTRDGRVHSILGDEQDFRAALESAIASAGRPPVAVSARPASGSGDPGSQRPRSSPDSGPTAKREVVSPAAVRVP